MVESIKDLREICQANKVVRGRQGEQWIGRMFFRKFSIYFTKVFLYTPLTANQISFLSSLIALSAAILLAIGVWKLGIIAGFLFFLAEVVDHSDGEVARYRKTAGIKGERVESYIGHFEIPLYWGGVTFASFMLTNSVEYLAAGFIVILLFMKIERLKELKKDYQNKEFQNTPLDTVSAVTKSPKRFITFIAFSKYFNELVIIVAAVLNILPIALLAYSVISVLGYIAYGIDYLKV